MAAVVNVLPGRGIPDGEASCRTRRSAQSAAPGRRQP